MKLTIENLQKLREVANSAPDWIMFRPDAAGVKIKRLWVVFSHVNLPKGKFSQSKFFQSMDGHQLFLNCADNQWYLRGINGLSNDLKSTINVVIDLVAPFDAVFVGHSMGAYMSLAIGISGLGNGRFIATSPELYLGAAYSRSFNNKIRLDKAKNSRVVELVRPAADGLPGQTYYGAFDPIDCYFLAHHNSEMVGDVYEIPYHHGVTEYFTKNRIYEDILNALPQSLARLENENYLFPKGHFGTKAQKLHFYETFCELKSGKDIDRLRGSVDVYPEWLNPGWQSIRGRIFSLIGDHQGAFDAAAKAYNEQPDIIEYICQYAYACLQLDDYVQLDTVLRSIDDTQKSHVLVKRLMERIYAAPKEKAVNNSIQNVLSGRMKEILKNLGIGNLF